jgi:hypothetical protein
MLPLRIFPLHRLLLLQSGKSAPLISSSLAKADFAAASSDPHKRAAQGGLIIGAFMPPNLSQRFTALHNG